MFSPIISHADEAFLRPPSTSLRYFALRMFYLGDVLGKKRGCGAVPNTLEGFIGTTNKPLEKFSI